MITHLDKEEYIDKIFNCKWEDLLVRLPANCIDLIITSPPYNVSLGIGNKLKEDSYDIYDDNMPYEDYLTWMRHFFTECNRVLKIGGRLIINIVDGSNGKIPTHVDFTYMLTREIGRNIKPLKNGKIDDRTKDIKPFEMMTTIIWDKKQIGSSTSFGSWKSPSQPSFPTQFEFMIVVGKETLKHEGDKEKITVSKDNFIRNSRALWSFPPEGQMMDKYDHPAVFPSELPRRLIDQLSYKDDVILDPFLGSGTTCAVAKEMGRHYVGSEMSKKYYNTAKNRINSIVSMVEAVDSNGNNVVTLDWAK